MKMLIKIIQFICLLVVVIPFGFLSYNLKLMRNKDGKIITYRKTYDVYFSTDTHNNIKQTDRVVRWEESPIMEDILNIFNK